MIVRNIKPSFGRTLRFASAFIALLLSTGQMTSVSYAWDSKEDVNTPSTHTLVVEQGLKVLNNDLSETDRSDAEFMAVLDTFQKQIYELKRGSVAPDYWASNFSLYQDHFYDPYTKSNFTILNDSIDTGTIDYIYQTAEYRSKEYTGWALQNWKARDYKAAVYQFGKGMHYFSDLCEPHHASNAIGGTQESSTKHSAFETYVTDTMYDYTIESLGSDTSSSVYHDALAPDYYPDFITSEANTEAQSSQKIFKDIFKAGDRNTWAPAAKPTMLNTQRAVALAIYRFAKEVTNPASKSMHNTRTDLNLDVRVKTTDGSITDTYGTDNDVFFGVELKNGRMMEWKLDKSGYNDHEKGCNDTYSVLLEKASGSDIRKAWLRKQRGWNAHSYEDNWHPEEIEVTAEDQQFHLFKPINAWLKHNTGIDLYTDDSPLINRKITATLTTKEGTLLDGYGTDSDVFLGVEYSNGSVMEKLLDIPMYNDFETGNTDTYTFNAACFEEEKPVKLWLRKTGTDDWMPLKMTVEEDGHIIFSDTIEQWINESNPRVEWPIGS